MRNFLLALILLSFGQSKIFAADGYTIRVKYTDVSDRKVFLAHYYGKPLPTIYKVDSGLIDKKGNVVLQTKEKIVGGLYLMILDDNSRYFEFLLDNGQTVDMTATAAKLPLDVTFKNSPENEQFFKYVSFLDKVGREHQKLMTDLGTAKSQKDTAAIQDKFTGLATQVSTFRKNYVKEHPETFLSNIFRALETPDIPELDAKKGKVDDEEKFRLYKKHYWDNVAFDDDRLVYTPLLGSKLDEYFSKYVAPIPDTFSAEADALVKKARASKEIFKYVVHWITTYAQESNLMGMDAVFVHMVENYYMKGEAFWLGKGTLDRYIERARSIAPNVIGNVAPELKGKYMDGTDFTLSDVKAKYTLLIFWSPDCGHCREEIPRIDSTIKAEGLDKKGLKVVAFNIDKETDKWKKLIKEDDLGSWIHIYDPERTSKYRAQYDVYGTPSIYLLDDKKIIRGKKLDYSNMTIVVKILEEEAAAN